MKKVPKKRRIVVIAKQREYDEERWKHFITALAYALYERQQAREAREQTSQDSESDS